MLRIQWRRKHFKYKLRNHNKENNMLISILKIYLKILKVILFIIVKYHSPYVAHDLRNSSLMDFVIMT